VVLNPCTPRPSSGPYLSPRLERAIGARWKVWVPWVRMHLLRAHQSDPAVDSDDSCRRLRQRHTEHIVAMMREGITMRLIRKHRLDDPRLTDEVHAVLVGVARERQSKAWFRRSEDQRNQERLATLIRLGPPARDTAIAGLQESKETLQSQSQPVRDVTEPQDLRQEFHDIQKRVSEHFYLTEMRDPELTVRTNRRAYVLPRQIAMYIVRQLTAASLPEIGRQFGGRHHTTVLHAINKIEELRRADKALDRTITQLIDAVVAQT